MIFKDVNVDITRETAALDQVDLSLPLVLVTSVNKAYQEYSSAAAVLSDYGADSPAYKIAAALFAPQTSPATVAIVGIAPEDPENFTEVIEGLGVLFGKENGWTYLVSDVRDQENMKAIGEFCTANSKYYFGAVDKNAVETITNPESDYVIYIVHDDIANQYPEATWVGACSIYDPGSATWKDKTLSGITPVAFDDQAVEVKAIHEHNYNTYVRRYGLSMTTEGKCTSGEYIDVMLGVQWMEEEMELRIMALKARSKKIPYDNSGIAQVAAEVESVLKDATAMGIIRKDTGGNGEYEIYIPDISEIPTNDIANRDLNKITFVCYLAGAIHYVGIKGVATY